MVSIISQSIYTVTSLYVIILNVSRYKFTKRQLSSVIAVSVMISAILGLINPKLEGLASVLLVCFAAAFLFWKTKDRISSISFSVLSILIFIASMQLAIFIFDNLIRTKPDSELGNMTQVCFFYSIVAIANWIISKFTGGIMRKKIKNILLNLNKKYSAFILLGFFLVLIFFYYQIFGSAYIYDRTQNAAISSAIATLFLAFLLGGVFSYLEGIKKSLESAYKQEQLNQLQAYTVSLENMYTDMRRFRHDYMNIITPMYGYLEANDFEGLRKYFTNSVAPVVNRIEGKNTSLDMLMNIHMIELKGLLAVKLMQAQDKGIHVHIEVADEIKEINFDMIALTQVIGNLIDNAVEAALETENPVLKFAAWKQDEVITMLIINSFKGPLPPFSDMSKDGFSTKGENRGLGLYTVRQIIDSTENAIINTIANDDEFTQELIISNK